MKKLLIFLIFITCYNSQLIAQDVSWGIKAGVNLSEWKGQNVDNSGFLKGYHVGPTVSLKASNRIDIVPSLLISQKGNQWRRVTNFERVDVSFYADSKKQYKFTYLEMPVHAKFRLVSGLSLYTGPQFSYLLKASSKSESYSTLNGGDERFEKDTEDNLKGYKKFDLAVVFGIDYLFSNGINLNAGYDFGLYELEDVEYYGKSYNRVIKFSVGYYF